MLSHLIRRTLGSMLTCLDPAQGIGLARWLGRGLADGNWPAIARAERQLALAFGSDLSPEKRATLARESFVEAAACWAETMFLARGRHWSHWRDWVEVEQPSRWEQLRDDGRGAIVATSYVGNPAVAAAAAAELLGSAWLVTWPLTDVNLRGWQESLVRRRGKLKALLARHAVATAPRLLEAGERLIVIAEHERATGPAVELTFLGQPHRCYPTIGVLADGCDVPVAVVVAHRSRTPFRFTLRMEELIDPRELPPTDRLAAVTRRVMSAIERSIRRSPEQYLWSRPWLGGARSLEQLPRRQKRL
ncbi:MAG TPA: hypothetical protein VMZ31_02200 [Phycisphaerae bacterium]|nr:hypothetical protein [Phycisphaerae bacterium]